MSFVAPSDNKIVQESLQFNLPTSEASISAIAALANALREEILPVGSIVASMLDESTFQAQNTNPAPERWVLADGRDVTGSLYNTVTGSTTIPDLRGNFLRGKNNGRSDGKQNPDGDLSLGAYTASKYASHNHGVTDPGHNHGVTDSGHTHTVADPGHTHTVTDPGHNHTITDPQHGHGYTDPTHTHTISDPGHTHPVSGGSHTHQIFTGLFGESGGSGNILYADDAKTHSRTANTQATDPGGTAGLEPTGILNNAATIGITINNASTGISINSHTTGVTNVATTTGLTVNINTTGVSINTNTTGVTTNNSGGNETAPENYTINWFIRIN